MKIKKRYIISGLFTGLLLYLTHHVWMGHSRNYTFDFYLFSIVIILGFLSGLKITSYLADFKNIKKQSWIEIVFLTVFFAMLFIPMSNINKAAISGHENRKLAIFPSILTADEKLNFNFGKEYDNWFNDRFFLRNNLIDTYYKLKMINSIVVTSNGSIYNQKTHWMFEGGELNYNLQNSDISAILRTFTDLNKFCRQNNIKLYVLIVPWSADIYSEEAYPYLNAKLKQTNYDIVKNLQINSDAKIIFPLEELKTASKENYVYFKTDPHWTDLGAYIGYMELMKVIKKDYPMIKPVPLKNYNKSILNQVRYEFDRSYFYGNTITRQFPFLKKQSTEILDTKFTFWDHKDVNLSNNRIIHEAIYKGKTTNYSKGNNFRVLAIGTSMIDNLAGFTQFTFKNFKHIRLNSGGDEQEIWKVMKNYKKYILDYKPDILIFCIVPPNLERVPEIFKED